jgi:hypothetical protein
VFGSIIFDQTPDKLVGAAVVKDTCPGVFSGSLNNLPTPALQWSAQHSDLLP